MFRKQVLFQSLLCVLVSAGIGQSFAQDAGQTPGRGAIPPANLDALANTQREINNVTSVLLQGTPATKPPKPACSPTMTRFDWRDSKKVSPIQNQRSCGDCWAFAAVAAYESSDLIENGATAPNPYVGNASEQEALDCAYALYTCAGGWHDKVFDYFVSPAEGTRPSYSPYKAVKQACQNVAARVNRALRWDYVKGATIPANNELKQAICDHGPVVAAVSADGWDERLPNNQFAYSSTQNPNWQKDFPNGVYTKGTPSNPALTMATLKQGDIDHDVLIVGWDDKLGTWLIKNSWGQEWGEQGYMKLPYDKNNLGFNAAWVQASQRQAPLSPSLVGAIESVNRNFKLQFKDNLQ
jgi:C1A family cysteine protease